MVNWCICAVTQCDQTSRVAQIQKLKRQERERKKIKAVARRSDSCRENTWFPITLNIFHSLVMKMWAIMRIITTTAKWNEKRDRQRKKVYEHGDDDDDEINIKTPRKRRIVRKKKCTTEMRMMRQRNKYNNERISLGVNFSFYFIRL